MVKYLLVTHGDYDGIASAVEILAGSGLPLSETQVIFTQPFLLDKITIQEDVEQIFITDIAINNRDPEMTKNFISLCGDRLAKWFDHHQGWPTELRDDSKFVIIPEAKSCASIVGTDLQIMADADAADSRIGELSPRGQLIEQAMKANLADDSIRFAAVKWLLGDESQKSVLEEAAKKYAEIQDETELLSLGYVKVGNVAIVDARRPNHQYDLTQLLLAGQKLAPFAVVRTVHPQQGEGLTIATNLQNIDLVAMFALASGAKFRVSLPGKRLEETLVKLQMQAA
jgi:hypothetical protein